MQATFGLNIHHLRFKIIIMLVCILTIVGCGGGDNTMTLGGYILLEDDTPLEEVEVSFFWPELESGPLAILTDNEGWYSYEYSEIFEDDHVIITPSHPNYIFLPLEYDFQSVNGDNFELDFVAIPKDMVN